MREDKIQAKIFIGVSAIVIVINLVGILYGLYADAQYEQTKQLIQHAYNQEYQNGIEELIANCEKGAKILWQAVAIFGIKICVGILTATILIIPEKLYEQLKIDILRNLIPSDTYQIIVEVIIFAMLIWNMVSPILDIGNYISLYNEVISVIADLNFERVINDIPIF